MKLNEICRLQIQTSEPDGFVLSQSELNDNAVNISGLENFRLNVNAVLDQDQIEGSAYFYTDVLGDSSSINISRGMILDASATPYAVAGSVTALVRNEEFDPFHNIQFKVGANTRFQVL